MASRLNPYVQLGTEARAALEFWQSVFGGELNVMTFAAFSEPGAPEADLVMHGQLETPAGFTLMAADTPPGMDRQEGSSIAISLSGDDADDLRRWFTALSDGGTVTTPLAVQVWGDEFGMCVDRFGVSWMANIASAHPAG
jgi:PhnB protein